MKVKAPNAQGGFVKRVDDPAYMKKLFEKTGMAQVDCAKLLGVSIATLRCWTDENHSVQWPYPAQYALEQLAAASKVSK